MKGSNINKTITVLNTESVHNVCASSKIGQKGTIVGIDGNMYQVKFSDGFGFWNIPMDAVAVFEHSKTPFQRVAEMNEAFGNPKGDYQNIDFNRLSRQCRNILDEFVELMVALGAEPTDLRGLSNLKITFPNEPDLEGIRDALADIQVFKDGALHMMGVDGDADMHAVVDGVMTRFIKDEADKEATIALHASKGVTDVYFEGEYPKMVMKSASDQPDAPKGKFLKSASYQNTVFPEVV